MARRRRSPRLALWTVLLSLTWPAAGMSDEFASPLELAVAEQEAEEALFDGDYAEAIRLADKAMQWMRDGNHKLILGKLGFDWSTREALIKCLQGQAFYYLGNETRSLGALESAARQLQSRRLYNQQKLLKEMRGIRNPSDEDRRKYAGQSSLLVAEYLLYDAFIEMLKGEMQSPVPDFGVANLLNPAILQTWQGLHGDTGKAGVCFRAAQDKILQVEGAVSNTGGQEILLNKFGRLYRRSRLKLFVSFARLECWGGAGQGPLDARMRDADDLIARAEDAMKGDTFWNAFLSPDSLFAIRYADLAELKNNAAEGIDKTDVIRLKQLFAQSSDDYLTITMTRAEIAELRERQQQGATARGVQAWAPEMAERWYQQALLFARSNFAPRHPLVRRLELSKGRWYATRSTPPTGTIKNQDVRRLVSMARDCLHHARRIAIEDAGKLTPREGLELRFLELRALQNMLDIHDRAACFQPEQIADLDARKNAVIREIEDIMR